LEKQKGYERREAFGIWEDERCFAQETNIAVREQQHPKGNFIFQP